MYIYIYVYIYIYIYIYNASRSPPSDMEYEYTKGVHLADNDGHIQVASLCRLLPEGYISLSIIFLSNAKNTRRIRNRLGLPGAPGPASLTVICSFVSVCLLLTRFCRGVYGSNQNRPLTKAHYVYQLLYEFNTISQLIEGRCSWYDVEHAVMLCMTVSRRCNPHLLKTLNGDELAGGVHLTEQHP